MTTTELIELLKKHERGGATGRPREVMFEVDDRIVDTDGIEITGSGDGLISELYLSLPSAQPVIRCKDCKHKPHTSDKYDYDNGDCGFEIIFPDYRCPCRCEDEYYNHIPDNDWFCGNAERKEQDDG